MTTTMDACSELESVLLLPGGPKTILVVGNRRSGKTTVCETVIRRMNRHVVRWTPYEEFIVGDVSAAYSDLDTIIFVDDADVLVKLTKGCSVELMNAIRACALRPRLRIVMTALDTKGRVWRTVAACADVVQRLTPVLGVEGEPEPRPKSRVSPAEAWTHVMRAVDLAVSAKHIMNWCDARDADAIEEGGAKTTAVEGLESADVPEDPEHDGCVARRIAHMLLSKK